MFTDGFIKIPRSLLNDSKWVNLTSFDRDLYLAILGHIRFEEQKFNDYGTDIIIKPGQVCASFEEIAKWCGVYQNHKKPTKKNIENSLARLRQVFLLGLSLGHKRSIITITHTDTYNLIINNLGTTLGTTLGRPWDDYKKNKVKESKERYKQVAPDVAELVDIFLKKILERKPDFKKPSSLDKWHDAMDKIIRIDCRSKESILAMILWIHDDPFWKTNILSPEKLRKQFDQIQIKMSSQKESDASRKNRDWAVSMKDQFPEELRKMKFDAKFVGNPEAGKEIPFSLPEEQFQRAFVTMFGGVVHD